MEVTLKLDDPFYLSLTMEIDKEKFTDEMAANIANGITSTEGCIELGKGCLKTGAIKLLAAECFQQAAFNGIVDGDDVERYFDWSQDNGVDGFPSFQEMGIKVTEIENLFVDPEWIDSPPELSFS